MSNQVLALKYRPKRFEDLIGQDTISTTLSLALDSDRLSHAYLFSGLRGSGKTSTARIMAKALVCENAPTSKPCEVCAGCQSANDYKHLDIIEMDAASNRGIDDIKDLIEHTKYKPTSAKYKVFIIDEVHMLTTQAFNALLKTLEEPPAFVKFILATTDPLKLPATILSRTQHFRFKKISDKNILHHLTHILNLENIGYENEALEILIRSGQGSLRDTLTLLDQAIIFSKGTVSTSAVTDMMGMIDPAFMDKMFDVILQDGDTSVILHELESYEAGQVIDEISIYLKHKMLKKDVRFDTYLFDRYFRILGEAKQLLSINSDGGFVLILTLAKLSEATKLKTIDEIIEEVKRMPVTPTADAFTITHHQEAQPQTTQQETVQQPVIEQQTQTQPNIEPQVQEQPVIQQEQVVTPQPEPVIEQPVMMEQPTVELDVIQNAVDIEQQPIIEEPPVPQEVVDNRYTQVTDLIYDRSYELGECFKESFLYNSYENGILTIDSCATDEARKMLHKNFAYIRGFIEDIYGHDTTIEFNKIQKDLPQSPSLDEEIPKQPQEPQPQYETGSMIEDVELGSGCVATMGATTEPSLAQKELDINDILNSKFVNKAIELFQPETQIRVKPKV
jgi:DNA polymerase-3 subunit gamma/tau